MCIIAFGVVEEHSEHLPLGTDFLNGHKIACLAAEREPAVVFPPFYFGQIYEARRFPGTITLKPTLLMEVIQSVLDEIGRNGFRKIILLNAHGGNTAWLAFLAQCTLWEEKPYSIYRYTGVLSEERRRAWDGSSRRSYTATPANARQASHWRIIPNWCRWRKCSPIPPIHSAA